MLPLPAFLCAPSVLSVPLWLTHGFLYELPVDFDFEQRRVTLPVRELAEFRLGPPGGGGQRPGRWRAELGQIWHETLRQRTSAELAATVPAEGVSATTAAFEVTLRGALRLADWTFELQGRIDQVLDRPEGVCLREVKSVSATLPLDPAELRSRYPEYFAQVAIYALLAPSQTAWAGRPILAEVVFVEVATGLLQTVPVEDTDLVAARRRGEALAGFLEHRRDLQMRLGKLQYEPPFTSWREGQAETRAELFRLDPRTRQILFEAPTGFGKTGILLEYGLNQLRRGLFDRLIYLTGKSTGQLEVVRQLNAMLPTPGELPVVVLRNRDEHSIQSPRHTCDPRGRCRHHADDDWAAAGLSGAELLAAGPMTVDRARALGAQHAVCPYAISRACLPFATAWLGDFHYVFAPGSRAVFLESPGFRPSSALLIIDEAHNLPERVADACSARLDGGDLIRLATELTFSGAPPVLSQAVLRLADVVNGLPAADALDPDDAEAVEAALAPVARAVSDGRVPVDDLLPASVDQLWELADLFQSLRQRELTRHYWSPLAGMYAATCLDASPIIAERLGNFGQVVLASATLSPPEDFAAACGLPPSDPTFLPAWAPWREGAYSVAVDVRADTRYRSRQGGLPMTAETVALVCEGAIGPVAVFFPSYAYAETVRQELNRQAPWLRVAAPPRAKDLVQQRAALEEALVTADVLLLVLGTGFTEGIDLLGGRVSRAMVVGPALPEVSPPREARRRALTQFTPAEAFQETYLRSGLLRVNQALGRLVRAPGQRAQVLLFCRRFTEPDVAELLATEYQGGTVVRSREDLVGWLRGT